MSKMKNNDRNLQIIKQIHLFFMIAGFLEVFIFVSLTHIIYLGIIGIITIIPSYLARDSKGMKYNNFPGIWAILKYNPIVIVLLYIAANNLSFDLFENTVYVIYAIVLMILAMISFILGIILILKSYRLSKGGK